MSVCYFYMNYDYKYKCEYEIKDSIIEVEVEYEIEDEIDSVNGVKIFGVNTYFQHFDLEKLGKIPNTPKVSRIKVFSKAINDLVGYPSLLIQSSDSKYSINLSREKTRKSVEINSGYVKMIIVGDDWKSQHNRRKHNISIDFSGYIEMELTRRVNYNLVSGFVNELIIFMQLYFPDKFLVDKIYVMVDGEY